MEINYRVLVQNILQYMEEGIHSIDKNGKTILYNEVMAELEGLEKDLVLDKHILDIFPSLNEETSTLLTVMKTGRPIIDRPQTYVNYKGKKITTVNTTIPLVDDGKQMGALEIAKNVTRIKELSEQLIDLQQELIGNNTSDGGSLVPKYNFEDIIGSSRGIKEAIDLARRASKSSSSVLIYGETGSGKELVAQSIHYEGNRRHKAFIAQNCAALPESLLEGILFGTVKGGFTGAIDRPGLFEQANGGTILLDEINSMGQGLQAKLLRVLQEGYIRRVGGLKDIPIDVKVIATTNEDPKEAIEKGNLRKDLYYRLNVISINIPSLRERREDIKLLVEHFIKKYNKRLNKDVWMLSQEVYELLFNHSWPGNIRELENMIEGAMNYILWDEHVLREEHFPSYLHDLKTKANEDYTILSLDAPLPDIVNNLEKRIIQNVMMEYKDNVTKAAIKLGIKRQTLQHKIKKYQL